MSTTTTDKVADAANAAGDVAGTAKEQTANVVGEAVAQTQNLLGQAGDQIAAQATEQTQRLSQNIRELAQHFTQMAQAGEPRTTAHSMVGTAAQHAERAAGYLDGKQPGELVADLQSLGRRRPGAFLLGAALAGVAVGRLTGAAKRASGDSPATTPQVTGNDTQSLHPLPPVRNAAPGAATIETVEPYPGGVSGARTL